ncbi:Aspartate aminotransferase, cytoplasmic [Porphyridium purpureum]|uniref:Aspartate aminotransferase n=1 Tax=Porphyridium purpureum TaxID=35688 RepID=A0A5J4YT58_PORPP|nr:Aspartate aminotransferase, cytoplasmic [Porphyridium purpureum]|eukprot:POR6434..scf227_4
MAALWKAVPEAPADPILGVAAAFRADPSPNKVNLGVGAYRTEHGKPYVLPVVARVHRELLDDGVDHEYLPMEGYAPFISAAERVILGDAAAALREGRVASVQALSGTGSLRVAFEFLKRFYRPRAGAGDAGSLPKVYVPSPTWSNHRQIVPDAGLGDAVLYRYFNAKTHGVDFSGMCADLRAAPPGSVVLFHGCAHNPTGADPTMEQWVQLLDICKSGSLLPLFDNAYQGFASGDLNRDAASVRLFADAGIDLIITQSFAKNMGLYGERVGCLSVVMSSPCSPEIRTRVLSQLKLVVRPMYSSPPALGAKIAARILGEPGLFAEWNTELQKMSSRIYAMRVALRDRLIANGAPGSWQHVVDQIGMFSFTGLTPQQVAYMVEKHHIYLTSNGRISIAGLNPSNINYVADAMKDAIEAHPSGDASKL